MKAIPKDVLKELEQYAKDNGRNWKAKLRAEWTAGAETLRWVRSAIGPSGLDSCQHLLDRRNGMLRKRKCKPSTFFRKLEWADKDVLRTADRLGVRLFDLPDHINKCEIQVSMPGTAEGTSWAASVLGYGAYATVNMIVAAHVAGQKSQK